MIEISKFFNEIGVNEKSDEDLFLLSHFLCKTYGWDYCVLMRQPIPFVLYLIKANEREAQIQKEENPLVIMFLTNYLISKYMFNYPKQQLNTYQTVLVP